MQFELGKLCVDAGPKCEKRFFTFSVFHLFGFSPFGFSPFRFFTFSISPKTVFHLLGPEPPTQVVKICVENQVENKEA